MIPSAAFPGLWLVFCCFVVLWDNSEGVLAVDIVVACFLLVEVWGASLSRVAQRLAVGVVGLVVSVNVGVRGVCGGNTFFDFSLCRDDHPQHYSLRCLGFFFISCVTVKVPQEWKRDGVTVAS